MYKITPLRKLVTKGSFLVKMTAILSICAPSMTYATNGMFLIAPGTKARGMGGVAITTTHDTLSSAINPAVMARTGNRFDIGGDILFIDAESTLGQGGSQATVKSEPEHFTIADSVYMLPNMGASWDFGDMSYGFTMVGVGGGGSKYNLNLYNNTSGANPGDPLGVSLLIMNINPTVAMKLDDNNSVGATMIIGVQVFKAFGLTEFTQFTATQSPTANFTNNGAEVTYGFGLRIGWLGENFLDGKLSLGAEYTSKTDMKEFDKYNELFAEQGDLDTPGNVGIGAMYEVSSDLSLAFDINYIMYDQVKAISNIGPNSGAGSPFPVDRPTNALGEDGGLGFGWENQTVYKLGAIYNYSPEWTIRGGWNYGKSPINEQREVLFNIVAPATTQHHLTLGGTYLWSKDVELSFSFIHAFEHDQFGPTFIGYEGRTGMSQNALGATYSMQF